MKNLLYKELKMVISPAAYLFPLLAGLLLIPSYPYVVGIMYFFFSIQITFQIAYANKDIEFTSMLPIPRKQIVLSKFITVVYIQLIQLLMAIPFALLTSLVLNKGGNIVGMDANFAFFGFALIEISVFNLIFLPNYFKTGYKIGLPLVLGLVGFTITSLITEFTVAFVPVLKANLDSLNSSTFGYQFIALAVGIVFSIVSLIIAYKISVKNFEKVNL